MKKLMTYITALTIFILVCNINLTFGQENRKNKSVTLLRLKGSLTKSGSLADEAVIYFYNGATVNYDYEFDGRKLLNTDPQLPNIYTITPEQDSLVINGLPDSIKEITVPLNFDVLKEGDYTIWASEISNFDINTQILIEDTKENITYDLSSSPQYQCHVKPTDKNRFIIHFATVNNTTTEIGNFANTSEIFNFYTSKSILYLKSNDMNTTAKVNIYDLSGKKAMNTIEIKGGSHIFNLNTLTNGFYLITLENSFKILTKKVYIGN